MGFPVNQTAISGAITANGQTFVVPANAASMAIVQMVATALVGHNAAIEGSMDSSTGSDGNWFTISASRSNAPATIEQATGVLAATPSYTWQVPCIGLKYIRFRATAHTSGTATYSAVALDDGVDGVMGGAVTAANADNMFWNDSVTAQAASATVTGTARDAGVAVATACRYAAFNAFAFADVAGTLRIEVSTDNVTWRKASADQAITPGQGLFLSVPVSSRYHRAVFVNGATAQASFMLNTSYTVA